MNNLKHVAIGVLIGVVLALLPMTVLAGAHDVTYQTDHTWTNVAAWNWSWDWPTWTDPAWTNVAAWGWPGDWPAWVNGLPRSWDWWCVV